MQSSERWAWRPKMRLGRALSQGATDTNLFPPRARGQRSGQSKSCWVTCRLPRSVGGVTVLSPTSRQWTSGRLIAKRLLDLIAGIVGLLLALPLGSLIALAVYLTSPGPVIFRQERVTLGGRSFTMYKFRTMVVEAESAHPGKHAGERTVLFFKDRNDPCLTKVGQFLRSFSLDELPQLWNVIRGDMSLVGPRPLWIKQLADQQELRARHIVKAGITGWWQINGRSDLDSQTALRMDEFYIQNWSLSLDLYILLKTIPAVLSRRGAY